MTSEVTGMIQGLSSQSFQTSKFAIIQLRAYLLTLNHLTLFL